VSYINGNIDAASARQVQATLPAISDENACSALEPRQHHVEDADWPGSNDEHRIFRANVEQVLAVENAGQRLESRRSGQGLS
jgi:hypothetical protein